MKVMLIKVISRDNYKHTRDFWTNSEYYYGDEKNLGRFTTKEKALDRIRRWAENEKGFSFEGNHYREIAPVFDSSPEIKSEEIDIVGLFYNYKDEPVASNDDWYYATYAFIKSETYIVDEDVNEPL